MGRIEDFEIQPDGSLSYKHSGGTEIFWDGMTTEIRPHPDTDHPGVIFGDEAGKEFHEDDLLRCLPGARISGCPHCEASALATAGRTMEPTP